MKKAIRNHIIFYGRVQGVGFRYYARHKARRLGLTGWVRNLYDGTVEMEVQGTLRDIEELISYLESQRWIRIEAVDRKSISLTDDRDFIEKY